jgi:4-amino-4-deoxy-L-arabinose transferase-like glycosyltransferase
VDEIMMRRWLRPSLVLALVSLVLHMFANGHYGFFRDELYFIVCGERPDWGYVDQPAVVPLLAAWSHGLFGDFLLGFRLLPALVMSGVVAMTAEFVCITGGGRFAQWLGGLCVLLGPIFLIQGVLFSTDMFQALTWLALAWVLVRLEQTGNERWWLAFGAIAGFSLNTKYLIAFFLAALAIGLLATPQRKSLLRPWVWLGLLLAAMMVLPNVLWQQAHGWPFIELGEAGSGGKNVAMPLPAFFLQQLLQTGPLAGLVWLAGLWAGAVGPKPALARAFPVAWAILLVVFVSQHGKPYYLAPIYPILLGLGAVRIETWFRHRVARGALLAAVAVTGAITAPLTLPIMPVETFVRYQSALGFAPAPEEHLKQGVLPQYYADMFGWRDMARRVAAVYRALPPEDRAHAVFWGNNYGEAAAIDIFGRPLGLPPAIGGHNNYYLWGPRGADGSVIIIVGGDPAHYQALFRSFTVAGHVDAAYAMPYETDQPIYVLRGMKMPLAAYWPEAKSYN